MSEYQNQGGNQRSTGLIVWSVIGIFTCTLFGIGALVLTLMGDSKVNAGDVQGGENLRKWAKWALIIGAVLSVLSFLFLFFVVGVGALIGADAAGQLSTVGSEIDAPQ